MYNNPVPCLQYFMTSKSSMFNYQWLVLKLTNRSTEYLPYTFKRRRTAFIKWKKAFEVTATVLLSVWGVMDEMLVIDRQGRNYSCSHLKCGVGHFIWMYLWRQLAVNCFVYSRCWESAPAAPKSASCCCRMNLRFCCFCSENTHRQETAICGETFIRQLQRHC